MNLEDKQGKIDLLLQKLMSRKMLVFIISTLFVLFQNMPFDAWMTIAAVFIGVEGVQNIILPFVLRKTNNDDLE